MHWEQKEEVSLRGKERLDEAGTQESWEEVLRMGS